MEQRQALARDICWALYNLFNYAKMPRSAVSEDDIIRQAGCTYEELASCLKEDSGLREIMVKTGFSNRLHDQSIFFSHA
jgi:hypothetical protein